jgi:hypothetical protein
MLKLQVKMKVEDRGTDVNCCLVSLRCAEMWKLICIGKLWYLKHIISLSAFWIAIFIELSAELKKYFCVCCCNVPYKQFQNQQICKEELYFVYVI